MKSELHLGYSPITDTIYAGKMQKRQNKGGAPYLVAIGERADVTQDFYHVLLQKFPMNTETTITNNGKPEFTVIIKSYEQDNAKEEGECI